MVAETISESAPFFVILVIFIAQYSHLLMLIMRKDNYNSYVKLSYTLALGELDEFHMLSPTAFLIFTAYTILITVVLMNLVIAILSDKYEEVMTYRDYYEGKAMLKRSLAYEKLLMAFNF